MQATLSPPDEAVGEASAFDQFEAELAMLPQIKFPLTHSFTPGVCIRQCLLPAGSVLTSMEHLTEHHFVIIEGTVDVISQFERHTYVGPYMGVTQAGTKRILHAHTDTLWMTIHPNPENITDMEEMAKFVIAPSSNPLLDSGSLGLWHESNDSGGRFVSEEISPPKGKLL